MAIRQTEPGPRPSASLPQPREAAAPAASSLGPPKLKVNGEGCKSLTVPHTTRPYLEMFFLLGVVRCVGLRRALALGQGEVSRL
jgi:hypothetical protein